MKLSKSFLCFNFLLVNLLIPSLCYVNLNFDRDLSKLESLKHDLTNEKKKKKIILLYSLIAAGTIIALSTLFGIGIYKYNKEKKWKPEYLSKEYDTKSPGSRDEEHDDPEELSDIWKCHYKYAMERYDAFDDYQKNRLLREARRRLNLVPNRIYKGIINPRMEYSALLKDDIRRTMSKWLRNVND